MGGVLTLNALDGGGWVLPSVVEDLGCCPFNEQGQCSLEDAMLTLSGGGRGGAQAATGAGTTSTTCGN